MYNGFLQSFQVEEAISDVKSFLLRGLTDGTQQGYIPPISTKEPKLSLSGSACAPANHVSVFLDP